jgi:hypothetical protein
MGWLLCGTKSMTNIVRTNKITHMKTCINWEFFKNVKDETLNTHDHKDINPSNTKKINSIYNKLGPNHK